MVVGEEEEGHCPLMEAELEEEGEAAEGPGGRWKRVRAAVVAGAGGGGGDRRRCVLPWREVEEEGERPGHQAWRVEGEEGQRWGLGRAGVAAGHLGHLWTGEGVEGESGPSCGVGEEVGGRHEREVVVGLGGREKKETDSC